jgi:hypothetical protein
VSWESFILLLRLLDSWQRWRWWVGFNIDLRGGCSALGRIGSMSEVELGYSDSVVVEKAKDKMENIASDLEPITWCG